ncbi:hypothetical protein BDB00DRAFT_834344 [Zychaea mexicana]|uniref:uncharacterized protein n=1 Tax=Zychaea mexicana TaxID=64656 RepID=UPI0022FE43B1|nr:uncharacterized protein BDB00DRAFT_834344 [Zychaea mexicana]KAI9491213.1 hypothetical protein BDB00DRAFT_834344 [Zychaea mexicana]
MIPLSRVDSDDRPAGLKLARNNTGYAYSSTTNTTATHTENAAGGSLFDDDLQWLDQRSRASMESSSRRIESGRFQHPSVPARSPFRIRDSQTSVASRAPSTTVTKPFQSTKWSPTFESEEPRNVIDNRASLSVEVARMWKRQPAVGASNDQDKGRKDDKSKEEGMDGLLGQLLVSQALVDAELYNTLTFEQLSELKQQRNELKERIASLEMRWAVDKQVQDVSRSLVQLDREHKNDTPSSRAASELIELLNEEAVIRQKILEHTAGALKLGFESYKEDEHQQQKLEQQQKPVENSGRLREAEQEIESLKAQMKQMTAANSRETNQEIESLKAQIKQMTTANAHETDREVERLKAQIQQMAATNSRETNQEVDRLNARIKQMTAAMVSFGERQDLHEISDRSDEQQWISAVESQFSNYKLKMRRLERELESNEEKLRLESVTAKKIETQLRIMQDKRDAAETKYRDMEKKYLDRELNIDSYEPNLRTTTVSCVALST